MAGRKPEKISTLSLLVPIIILGIVAAVTSDILDEMELDGYHGETVSVTSSPKDATTSDDADEAENFIDETCKGKDAASASTDSSNSKCPKAEEITRLKEENELYRKALAWIDERQKIFADKFVNRSFSADKDSIIQWLKDVRDTFFKKFNEIMAEFDDELENSED